MDKYNLSDIFSDLNSESSVILPKSIKIKNIKNLDTISDATSSFMPQKGGYLGNSNNNVNHLLSMLSATSENNFTTNSIDTEQLKEQLYNILDGGSPRSGKDKDKLYLVPDPVPKPIFKPIYYDDPVSDPTFTTIRAPAPAPAPKAARGPPIFKPLPKPSDPSSGPSSGPSPKRSHKEDRKEDRKKGREKPSMRVSNLLLPLTDSTTLFIQPSDKLPDKLDILNSKLKSLHDTYFTSIFDIVLKDQDPNTGEIEAILKEYIIANPQQLDFNKIIQYVSDLLPTIDVKKIIENAYTLTLITSDDAIPRPRPSSVRQTLKKMSEGYDENQKKEFIKKIYEKNSENPTFKEGLESINKLLKTLEISDKKKFLIDIYNKCFETLPNSFINLFFYHIIMITIFDHIFDRKIISIIILDRIYTLYSRMKKTDRIIFSVLYNIISEKIHKYILFNPVTLTTELTLTPELMVRTESELTTFHDIIYEFTINKTANFTNRFNLIKDLEITDDIKKEKIVEIYQSTIENRNFIQFINKYFKLYTNLKNENQQKVIEHIRNYCVKIVDVNYNIISYYSFIELLFYFTILDQTFTKYKYDQDIRTLVFIFECIINIYFNMLSNNVTIFNNLFNSIVLKIRTYLDLDTLIPMKKIIINLAIYKIDFFTDFSVIQNEQDIKTFYDKINREISIDLFKLLLYYEEKRGYLIYIYELCKMKNVPLINLLLSYVITLKIAEYNKTNKNITEENEKIIEEIIKIQTLIENEMTKTPEKIIFNSLYKQILTEIATFKKNNTLAS